ncbi:MAG: 3-phosphoshikimate 1-carboxyvinyltransferase [Candidatus Azobacteroides sp.]|nr:3-phosphoshikimate 1-carboxyvinyltransferase [Candidatus Azobacteroides sp.]
MIYILEASPGLSASIRLPASKSISNRALILNALSKSIHPIAPLSDSDDTQVLYKALQGLETKMIDIGAAGTSMRFLTAYLSLQEGEWMLTGSPRMKNRPIGILTDALRQLGAEIQYVEKEGFPPLFIRGKKMKGGSVSLNGSVSSQFISALMMIAPALEQGLNLHLEGNIVSLPYIEMTVRLMERYGIKVNWEGQIIQISPQSYTPAVFRIEGDWSAASYWYEIQTLAAENAAIELQGLEKNSIQGDAACVSLFETMGIQTFFTDSGVQLEKNQVNFREKTVSSSEMVYDFTNEPDLAQTFVVVCCLSDRHFRFTGLQSLRIKETDRISALQNEMRKLGYLIREESGSILEWKGERCEPELDPVISTYDDHRMAMAFAPVCLKTKKIRIKDPEVVAKSYPNYWNDLSKAGFIITEEK